MSRRGGEAEDGGECEEGREKTEGKKMGSNRGREGQVEIMTLKMKTRDGRQWMWIEGIVSGASHTYNLALPYSCVILFRILRDYSYHCVSPDGHIALILLCRLRIEFEIPARQCEH